MLVCVLAIALLYSPVRLGVETHPSITPALLRDMTINRRGTRITDLQPIKSVVSCHGAPMVN